MIRGTAAVAGARRARAVAQTVSGDTSMLPCTVKAPAGWRREL